ncbi:MAG: carbohydrate kinase family protein [Candidatus Heimdallarchaeota archaeon]|nr:carbohydrate kinase family protein [Candidatus Heimdallarchaeota archaeon]
MKPIFIGVIGNCYFDEIYLVDKFPEPDDKITAFDMQVSLGGSATNVSAGLAKLKLHPRLISAIGNDTAGETIQSELKLRRIDPTYLARMKGQTGRTIILLENNKTSTKIGYPGVCGDLKKALNFTKSMDEIFDIIHMASISIDTAEMVIKNNFSTQLTLDFGARTLEATNEEIMNFLPKINLVFFNRNVFKRLYPKSKLDIESIKKLDFPCNVVITAGDSGLFAKIDGKTYFQPIYKVKVVDTTGAGDAAAAAILWGFLNKKKWDDNLKYGAAAAAIKLQTFGASNGHPTKEKIEKFIKSNKK